MKEDKFLYEGKMEEVLRTFEDNYCDSIVTDPPYGFSFMGKKWDYQVPTVSQWQEAYRVLKPGGYMLVACGTRTQHRMVVNIEDAGFEIRDVISWLYGSGFPKSLDVSKAIDKQAGAERNVIGKNANYRVMQENPSAYNLQRSKNITEPNTDAAKEWEGYGTALKPAQELWTLCRKPLSEDTVAENVLKHGTGGINIDACRIEMSKSDAENSKNNWKPEGYELKNSIYEYGSKDIVTEQNNKGRFPANIILDEFMASELDKQSGILTSGAMTKSYEYTNNGNSMGKPTGSTNHICEPSSGGASRFFYVAKPSQYERNKGIKERTIIEGRDKGQDERNVPYKSRIAPRGNTHPTVKPIELMRYLVRLITPKNGLCIDPFCGSGTTLIACKLEGFNYIGIDMEKEHCEIAEARVKAWNREKYFQQGLF